MEQDIKKLADLCIEQGKAEALGDYKRNNMLYLKIEKIYVALKASQRMNELVELYTHENPYVRLTAATYTLTICPQQAEKVLKDLMPIKKSLVGFTAEMTLQEWRKGNLKL